MLSIYLFVKPLIDAFVYFTEHTVYKNLINPTLSVRKVSDGVNLKIHNSTAERKKHLICNTLIYI